LEKVAVVILNWNGKELLKTFLPSVVTYSKGHAIVVADNASTDDSISFIKENYPEVVIVKNEKNFGFAGGYNHSLIHVDADIFVLLNSDVEVTEHWIENALKQFTNDPQVAAVQPKLRWYKQKEKFEYAGAAGGYIDYYGYPFCRGRMFENLEEDKGQYDSATEIFWASGAAFFVRRKVFEEVHGFDEDFFAHMEEIDLCWRIKNRGYKIMYQPSSLIYHYGGATLSAYNPHKTYLNFRNNLFLLLKNHPANFLAGLFLIRLTMDGIAGAKFAASFQFGHLAAILKAHYHFYRGLPAFLKKRKAEKPFFKRANLRGIFRGWIVAEYFLKGNKVFSRLNKNDFIE
jgi:GT2 family glycosyltransferase